MQLKRIGILVVAAAVLVVMTGGNAFAMHYDGKLRSDISGVLPYTVTKYEDPYGHFYPSSGTAVDWSNTAVNNANKPFQLIINQYTSPVSGLTSTMLSYGLYPTDDVTDQLFTAFTVNTNHYTINAQHKYTDFGEVWIEATSSQMQLW